MEHFVSNVHFAQYFVFPFYKGIYFILVIFKSHFLKTLLALIFEN